MKRICDKGVLIMRKVTKTDKPKTYNLGERIKYIRTNKNISQHL